MFSQINSPNLFGFIINHGSKIYDRASVLENFTFKLSSLISKIGIWSNSHWVCVRKIVSEPSPKGFDPFGFYLFDSKCEGPKQIEESIVSYFENLLLTDPESHIFLVLKNSA